MGRISKVASERHEATLSPHLKDFVSKASTTPTRELGTLLESLPTLWPFPRGDLYHWINVLNRFDGVLEKFNTKYGLDKGPQLHPFEQLSNKSVERTEEKVEDVPEDIDVGLVKTILKFTALLLTNCGNRSLYASSDRLNDLLHTTDCSLLQLTLQLSLLLAKRYYSSKQRMSAVGGSVSLSAHYNISVDRVRKLAAPFASPAPPPRQPDTPSASAKSKDKRLSRPSKSSLTGSSEPKLNGSDFVSIVKTDGSASSWRQWADIKFTFYPDKAWMAENTPKTQDPFSSSETPTIRRTTTTPTAPRSADRNVISHRRRSLGDEAESSSSRVAVDIDVSSTFVAGHSLEDALRTTIEGHNLPEASHFDFLQKLRVAKALINSREERLRIVGIRLLAIANLAYIESEPTFYAEFARSDSEQPRQLQVAFQLAELVQPASDDPSSQIPMELQSIALTTMDALTHQKFRANDVYAALNANVNHGILFYMVRKAVDQLRQEETAPKPAEEEWREALFSLLSSLPTVMPRAGDLMMSAGLLEILLDVLTLRTKQAERTHWKALTFLDTFVYSVRDGYQTFANAKGLDIAKELTAHVVTTSFEQAEAGEGMPAEYRAPITDYRIPFYQQSTLRWLFKFINHLMAHNNANFSRQMRNLIDSSEMLESFRKVMSHARIFGSNVWAGAVQIWTTFINNEPTSYSVIAESKLGECFLDALMKSDKDEDDDKNEMASELSLLPVSEAINAVPQAFQALCLNEAGMKLVVDSGALPKFFKVFTSPAHVKALDTDRELAQTLGASFDELCRHQPTLRNEISVAVRQMIAQVAFSCKQRAVIDGYGAKLWVGNDEGKLFVAGGREALVGSKKKTEPMSESDEDVEMSGVDAEQPLSQEQLSMDEVIESRKSVKTPYPTAFIGAATRFLIGYLPNANQCATFIQNGGVEDALDLATSPCLPFSFEAMECPSLHDDLGRMLALLSDAKVYILLPALTRRLQKVLNGLDDFLNHDDPSCAFFAPFTNTDRKSRTADLTDPRFADGTIFVKTLVTVNVLCSALCYIFTSTSMYAHRTANNVFLQVNLTDVWVSMVEKLGKLQRSCTWEEILLNASMPASWISRTAMPHQHFENDNVTDQILRFNGEHAPAVPSSDPAAPASSNQEVEDHHKPGTAQFENTRVLRHLFYQAPYEISQFFNAMGKMLLVRRPDPVQKQNATQIAEQLAKSQTEALTFHLPQGYGEVKRLHEYWTVTLVRISSLMVDDSFERTNPQTLTLVLKCFKEQDGFKALEKALESFVVDCKRLAALETADAQQLRDLANTMAGIKLVLHFYSRVINWKLVQDATQTTALAGRSSDTNGSDFSASQFLVELRYAIIKPAMRLWDESESAFMDKAITPVVRNLIEVLRTELDADGESKALTRKDKAPKKNKNEPRKWSPRSSAEVERLAEDHGRDVAMEALYRCYDNVPAATEYRDYAVQFFEGRESFLPISSDVIAEPRSRSSPRRPAAPSAGPSETPQPQREDPADAVASMLLDPDELADGDEDSPPQLPVLQMNPNALREMMLGGQPSGPDQPEQLLQDLFSGAVPTAALDSSRDASESPAPPKDDNRPLAGKVPDLVTVDDLNDERAKLRTSLIDRCLGILSVHDDVTFELADLIFSSVSRSSTSKEEARLEIANTLLLSLTSLQADEDASEDEQKVQNKRVACYAHLFALVLAKDDFYTLIEDELVDNFELLVGFITSDSVAKGSGAVANILLIVERLLSSDAVPQLIEYNLPNPDAEKIEKNAVVQKKPSLVSLDNKQLLFDALLKILLSVGKNESLALSTLRILVILTRNPKIASQLGEKQNIRRLFLMARQLQGMTDEKIQGSFLIVLRHIIEDEETILNIMRNEIVAAWSNRPNGRAFDTTTYLRHFSQMAIRSPDLFIKATNDKVAISNYSIRQVPQTLKLKEDPAAESKKDDAPASNGESSKAANEEKTARPESAAAMQKLELERTKTTDLKMPVVENPDGVIHFILSELLNYKEVEDTEPAVDKSENKEEQSAAPTAPTSTDIQMGNTAASPTASEPSTPTPGTPSNQSPKKDEKPSFKTEDHPVYIYRCFLLQCLTELLSCYNRTKVEFINFKRKPDAPGTTPSKPRSQVLNYLLHDLIPTGSLGHPEDVASKKREKTSSWAMSVVVSLCSKTGEGGFNRRATDLYDYKEEPDLLFVRKFVLEHAIKSYREAMTSDSDGLEQRYSRLLSLADLFNRMLTGKPNSAAGTSQIDMEMLLISQRMLAKIMYEKNFISAMTASISEIDLNFPNAKRAVKYILKPLKLLTIIANELSVHSETPVAPGADDESEIGSDSEVSVEDDTREQTPDLFRNSALGILDPGRDEDSDEDEDDEDEDDEDMYDDEFGEEMEYEEEMPDHDEVVSDEEQEIADMGPIEGRPGDVGVDMEIVGMEVEDDDDDEDDSDDSDDSDEDDSDEDDDDEMDEIIDIEEGEGVGADDEDWESQPDDEDEEDFPGADDLESDFPAGPPGMPAALDEIVRALEGTDDNPDEMLFLRDRAELEAGLPEGLEILDGDLQEEDEEEEEDFDEEEIAFEPEVDDDEDFDMGRGVPWGWEDNEGRVGGVRHHHHHHVHRQSPWGLFGDFRERIFPPSAAYRSHRAGESQRRNDDGTNPLLQRAGAQAAARPSTQEIIGLPGGMGRFEIPADGNPASFLNSLITAMSTGAGGLPGAIHHRGGTLQIQINNSGLAPMPRDLEQLLMRTSPGRRSAMDAARPSRDDPSSAVLFTPALTMARWAEESRILFGIGAQERALRIVNSILRLLVPPAIEELKRKQKEEAERLKKLEEEREKARKEKEEQERKEREEEEARKKKEEEERQAAEAEAATRASEGPQDEQMEGVEATDSAASEAQAVPEASAAEPAQRITTMIDGREIDITNLGIDPDYLAALPEDMRQEVIMEQTLAQRQTANDTSGEQQDLDPEFLQALPPEMRDELMQQIAHERRRNEREASRRRNATAGAPPRADDMDPASFFATLDPALRSQLLMEVDDEALGALPPQLQAEARQLSGHHRRLDHYEHANNMGGREGGPRGMRGIEVGGDAAQKRKPTTYAQILDKAGVATLLRLMFIQQSSSIRNSLNGILRDVCHNKQNRAEVVSILLSILQDGSNDIGAVERSFSLLSLRAKQPSSAQKTPQPKRATPEFGTGVGEMSPITVVQQCLVCLEALVQHNPRIAEFFLTEHETGTGFKPKSARKGKGKESKTSRYPINALLGLLDRKIIIESAPVMELLASLLQRITHPLLVLLRKEKQDKEKAAEEEKKGEKSEADATPAETATQPPSGADIVMTSPEQPVPSAPEATEPAAEGSTEQKAEDKPTESSEDKAKKRTLTPPDVPEYNLRLIINIIAARECPSKTFKDTLSLITNLSAIPEAKEIFGQELISQAQGLGRNILEDLQELEGQIRKASNGADVQGMALAKFSPASSDQAKLLRVITALDFLFDPKRAETQDKPSTSDAQSLGSQQKEDILTTLYENRIFVDLWDKLSLCLKEIHERENMFSVANILLPLIEVLMVVCKNTTLKDAPIKNTQQDFSVSSPEPESKEQRMESLFFRFTEDHRRILNELVRHNPKLMSGSFSLLVKNSKVLEFDNKRNYFTRRLHSRGQEVRQPHPSLQLSVRRDQVFLDSFKHLYYKKPDEFKYGKLSIRFAGEEGVDAGGVTREWFQALTKQMFDPNYALFVPVAADRTTFHPNSESAINEQHLTFFKFIGRIIGKALYEGRVLDCHFSRAVYKRILGRSISIKDMESLDNDYAKNLQWILDNDITDLITETFSVSTDVFGEEKVVDLIENGRDIEVTEDNKHEYVQRVVEYKLIGSVKEQMDHFLQGFHDIVPADLVSIFNEQELELLISGLPDIDVDDWRNNTEYHNYNASSPQIQWFWRAVRSFDKEERAKLLQFVTGTSKVPLNGFKELEGMNGFSRFNIHRDYGAKDRLPSSHTCFNQLDLPEYDSYEDLRKTLYTAITAGSEYFGFA